MKKSLVFITLGALLIGGALLYYLTTASPAKEAVEAARAYIEAVKNRDFKTIFNYHGPSQKRRFLILIKGGSQMEDYIERLYREQEQSFLSASPPSSLSGAWGWMEKFLFIPSGKYKITEATLHKHEENVSLPLQNINVRYYVVVTVKAEYPDREGAPVIGGSTIKSALLDMTMVHSSNIARTLRGKITTDRWLFNAISVREDSVEYWQ